METQSSSDGRNPPAHRPERQAFSGVRITRCTAMAFEDVVARLRAHMGALSAKQVSEFGRQASSAVEFEDAVKPRLGDSGFVLMQEIDHGAWLKIYGVAGRHLRWIYGNPLIAVTLIRPDPIAGLFAPLELLITEGPEGGAVITYVEPSSQIVVDGDETEALRTASKGLDAKVEALLALVMDQAPSTP
jgi:uncharacterized protein (DUF302 family)